MVSVQTEQYQSILDIFRTIVQKDDLERARRDAGTFRQTPHTVSYTFVPEYTHCLMATSWGLILGRKILKWYTSMTRSKPSYCNTSSPSSSP